MHPTLHYFQLLVKNYLGFPTTVREHSFHVASNENEAPFYPFIRGVEKEDGVYLSVLKSRGDILQKYRCTGDIEQDVLWLSEAIGQKIE